MVRGAVSLPYLVSAAWAWCLLQLGIPSFTLWWGFWAFIMITPRKSEMKRVFGESHSPSHLCPTTWLCLFREQLHPELRG